MPEIFSNSDSRDSFKGIKSDLQITGKKNEITIVNQFSEFFFITFSRESHFKSTIYYFDFMKPSATLRNSFNLGNEILILFSPNDDFATFKGRTLDFIDKTLTEYSNRLDKICIFLISGDNNVERITREAETGDKDSRVFIPFSYKELLTCPLTKDILENKLRRYFYSRDLFALESPLRTEAYFFGRNSIIQTLYDKYTIGEQGGLFGLRRSGKTSVLLALQRRVAQQGGVSVYFDCSSTAVHMKSWHQLLKYIIQETVKSNDLNYTINDSEERYNEVNAGESFENDLRNIFKRLDNKRILLIFDEIEEISYSTSSSANWRDENDALHFWQTLRPIIQKDNSLFSFIVAGVSPQCIESPIINNHNNPIFCFLTPSYLELFDVDDVKKMVTNIGGYMGLSFDEEVFTNLTDDYGGHPFLIRHVCSMIAKNVSAQRPYHVEKYEYREKASEYKLAMVKHVDSILYILEHTYLEEYELLKLLAIDSQDEFKNQMFGRESSVSHLLGYGILKKISDNYYITIATVTEYFNNKFKYEKSHNTTDDIWKMVTSRRGEIEIKLRKLVLLQITAQYGKQNVKDKLGEVLEDYKRKKMMQVDVNQFIENDFLFSELKKVIIKNWRLFQNIFPEQDKFSFYADHINKYRVDAHSKTISKDDLALLRVAFNWFEEALLSV